MTSHSDDSLRTGVPEIDSEHAVQIELLHALERALTDADQTRALEIISQLQDYTSLHFASEQLLMRMNDYPAFRAHEQEHGNLLDELRTLRSNIEAAQPGSHHLIANSITRWLIGHIQSSDQALADFLKQAREPK
ncbi:MAG TPA: bacteriohemerythrin [Thermoanaerobaculia bacterium]|nr:bacteriohemerythrin [Thermoanaerobaculia bacterium]